MSVVSLPTSEPAAGPGSRFADERATIARRRVCVLSEDLSGNLDEGVKKLAVALATSFNRHHDVQTLSTTGPVIRSDVRWVPASSRTFISWNLRAALRRTRPDVLIYATRRSATFASFLRARVLKAFCPNARIVMLGLQTRYHPAWQQRVIRRMHPDLIAVQSAGNQEYLSSLGCRVSRIPSGVDLERFRPVSAAQRKALRLKYGLRVDKPVVLHVGHLAEGRGIRVLAEIAEACDVQVLLVTSTSSEQEHQLAVDLRAAGVIVRTDFIPDIEQLYQLADCYVFPVISTDNAIEAPLSVLEALACDLGVVTTRYAGLPGLFSDVSAPGLVFVDLPSEITCRVEEMVGSGAGSVRHLVEPYSWDAVAEQLLQSVLTTGARQARVER